MKFGIVGLGRMGGNLARAAPERGLEVVGFDADERLRTELADDGLEPGAVARAAGRQWPLKRSPTAMSRGRTLDTGPAQRGKQDGARRLLALYKR
jgi:predicted dehydrogenase